MPEYRYLILVLLVVVSPVFADTNQQLVEIQHRVDEEAQKVAELKAERAVLRASLQKYQKLIQMLSHQEVELTENLAATTRTRTEALEDLQETKQRVQKVRSTSYARLRALYQMASVQPVSLVLSSAQNQSSLERSAYYVSKLQDYDKSLLDKLSRLESELALKIEHVEQLALRQEDLKARVIEKRAGLSREVKNRKALLSELESREKVLAESLAELQAQALRLETVIVSITSPEDRPARSSGVTQDEGSRLPRKDVEPYSGLSLAKQKSSLILPLKGTVLRGFGKQKHESFEDIVYSKGTEIAGSADAPVVAIAPGRVIFEGRLPGFGTVLIVDHGERYYSLYGRLGAVRVTQGRDVGAGEVIATLANPEVEGETPSLYFEIRKDGKATDPGSYFSTL